MCFLDPRHSCYKIEAQGRRYFVGFYFLLKKKSNESKKNYDSINGTSEIAFTIRTMLLDGVLLTVF